MPEEQDQITDLQNGGSDGVDEFADDYPLYVEEDTEEEQDAETTAEDPAIDEPEPAAEPQAEVVPSVSQFGQRLFTDDEQTQVSSAFDDEQLRIIELAAERAFQRGQASMVAQQRTMRAMGMSNEFMAEYGDELQEAAQSIPVEMRGTKQGAEAAALLAVRMRTMAAGGDLGSELLRAGQLLTAKRPPSAPKQREVVPPTARSTVPRPAPSAGVRTPVAPSARAGDYLQKQYGLTKSELRQLEDELQGV